MVADLANLYLTGRFYDFGAISGIDGKMGYGDYRDGSFGCFGIFCSI